MNLLNLKSDHEREQHLELLHILEAFNQHAILAKTNLNGEITFVNNLFCEISGYSQEELIGNTHRMVNSGYHSKEFYREMYACIKNEKVWKGEFRNRAKDGSIYWVDTTIVPLKNSFGVVDQFFAIHCLITDRKKVEEALEESKNFLDKIINKIAVPIFVKDGEHRLFLVNNALCALLNKPVEELIGKTGYEFHPKEEFDEFIKRDLEVLRTGNENTNEEQITDGFGRVRTIVTRKSLYVDKKGNKFIVGIIEDITERKKAQIFLAKSEQRYRGLFENLEAGIVVHATDTSILLSNAKSSELLGLSEEQMRGKIAIDKEWKFINEDYSNLPLSDYPVNKIINTKSSLKNQILGINRPLTNDVVWVSVNGFPLLNNDGSLSEIVISFVDISERKLAEELTKKNAIELEEINRAKDKFFNIIAHDLRNPFLGIIGIAEMLENEILKEDTEESGLKLKFTRLIRASSNSAFILLENLMLWAKSQTGDLVVKSVETSMNNLISLAIPVVSGQAFKKQIYIEEDLTDNDLVYADESMVATVLRNLLTNAIKFTNINGKIKLTTKRNKNTLEISVSDDGVGISPENLEKLFRIDSKITKLGTNEERGSGLGLILCKEFVEKQGGHLKAESEIGKGSTFTFTLPVPQ